MSATTTGTCYEDAARYVLRYPDKYLLVHATVTGQGPVAGLRFGHAFCLSRCGAIVVDPTNERRDAPLSVPTQLYFAVGEIGAADFKTYDDIETRSQLLATGHWGPWEGDDDE